MPVFNVQIFIHLSASAIVQDMGHQIKTVKIKRFGILGKFLRRHDGFERHYLKSSFNSLSMRNVKNLNPRAIPKVAIDHIVMGRDAFYRPKKRFQQSTLRGFWLPNKKTCLAAPFLHLRRSVQQIKSKLN